MVRYWNRDRGAADLFLHYYVTAPSPDLDEPMLQQDRADLAA